LGRSVPHLIGNVPDGEEIGRACPQSGDRVSAHSEPDHGTRRYPHRERAESKPATIDPNAAIDPAGRSEAHRVLNLAQIAPGATIEWSGDVTSAGVKRCRPTLLVETCMSKDPTGAEIAEDAPETLGEKGRQTWWRMGVLAVAAGVLIGFGGIAFLIVQAGTVTGPVQILSGLVFSVGLLMVMVTGAELFTGNTMFALPVAKGRLDKGRLAASWLLVWLGNLIGSLLAASLFWAAGGLDSLDGAIGEAAIRVAEDKLGKGMGAVIASGILANMLVCLAVWMAMGAKSLSAKAVALAAPVTVFVAAGFEHSVANMSLIPIGLSAGAEGEAAGVLRNLALSTVGNVIGGIAVALGLGLSHASEG
jgi:formate/nitrite transporter